MDYFELYRRVDAAIRSDDVTLVREVLSRSPGLLQLEDYGTRLLRRAAARGNVPIVALLVEFGADINAPEAADKPEGAIDDAAGAGAVHVVGWLLEHGARVNHEVKGKTRCWPLTNAVVGGHLDVVKLLVERGAEINATWTGQNALSFAVMYGQREIESYLRSKGALEPWHLTNDKLSRGSDPLLEHIRKHLGEPKPLALREVVAGEPSIAIYVIPGEDQLALVTSGMSKRPMTVPAGCGDYRFAELVMYLPANWPLTDKALRDANRFWPIEWLRRLARYPHENHTWLGGPSAVIANGEPPEPLAPNTRMTCLLALTEASEFGCLVLPNGQHVQFFSLFPLYSEERDLEKELGTEHLLRLFEKHKISTIVDVNRLNVARASGPHRRGKQGGKLRP